MRSDRAGAAAKDEDRRPITRLRAAAAVLRASRNADAAWLAAGIEAYQDGAAAGVTLDEALDLSCGTGAGTWWAVEARQRRDAALRRLRDAAFGGVGVTAAADAILRAVSRRAASSIPPASSRDELVDQVLRSGAALPASRRRLVEILRR